MRLLGGGSNILVRDEGVAGMVVQPVRAGVQRDHRRQARPSPPAAARSWAMPFRPSVREGLAGLETLVGIPGTIGGALHGNAGSRGGDIGQWTCQATVMTRAGEIVERSSRRTGVRLSRKLARRAGDSLGAVPTRAATIRKS